jgi:hypothetical protein
VVGEGALLAGAGVPGVVVGFAWFNSSLTCFDNSSRFCLPKLFTLLLKSLAADCGASWLNKVSRECVSAEKMLPRPAKAVFIIKHNDSKEKTKN